MFEGDFVLGSCSTAMDVTKLREDFPSLKQQRDGKPPIYFDNACLTLKPLKVIEAMDEYYCNFPACGGHGRSDHWFANKVTEKTEEARESIRKLINARSTNEIIFTRNTTEGINLVAKGFKFREGDIVLTTDKEHNSNLCPWRDLAKKGVIKHDVILSNEDNTFNMGHLMEKIDKNVKLVSMVHTSNLDGYTIPAEEIIQVCHLNGIRVMLDGAQSVPHKGIDVQQLDVDFLAFSLHKMCGPTGMGVLYAKEELLKELEPFIVGGDTVVDTFYGQDPIYLDPPAKFEAGLQNYAGMIGSGAAASYLMDIGADNIVEHELGLNRFLTENLSQYEDIEIIGPGDPKLRGGIVTFFIKRLGLGDIGERLDQDNNIMVRCGTFCVHSWFNGRKINLNLSPVRISLYFYNTLEECEIFLKTFERIMEETKDFPVLLQKV
ncbi:aminotransferase class V-fold PLP-dependent enzyme [bacterium]|nr:aminotransferase class V-fold PLP-dependent enzyme [bacterium]MBU1599525.1 aminotransferase class V-fold PLP-dependent enzyme [bacterium]